MAIPPTFPSIAAQSQYISFPVWNGLLPASGLKALLAKAVWTVAAAQTVDLSQAQQSGQLSNVQTIYIDNAGNDAPATITQTSGGGMSITVPPKWQGTFPFLSPLPPVFTVQSLGTGVTNFFFVNAPLPCFAWPTIQTTPTFLPGGAMSVSDVALDAAIANGAVNTQALPQASPWLEAKIDFAAAGVTALIAGVAAKIIRVYGFEFAFAGATNFKFQSAAVDLTGFHNFAGGGGLILDRGVYPWFTSVVAGDAFNINSSNAVQFGGRIYYTQI